MKDYGFFWGQPRLSECPLYTWARLLATMDGVLHSGFLGEAVPE